MIEILELNNPCLPVEPIVIKDPVEFVIQFLKLKETFDGYYSYESLAEKILYLFVMTWSEETLANKLQEYYSE